MLWIAPLVWSICERAFGELSGVACSGVANIRKRHFLDA
jgi:hypothetical protein